MEHAEDVNMLKAIVSYAKQADVGIEDMSFEIRNEELSANDSLPNNLPEGIVAALKQFALALKDSSEAAEMNLQIGSKNLLHASWIKSGRRRRTIHIGTFG